MTLVEVMVAFAILMITLVPAAYLLVSEAGHATSARNNLTALGIAEQWTEQLAQAQDPPPQNSNLSVWTDTVLAPSLIPSGWAPGSLAVTRGGAIYKVSVEYNWASPNGGANPNLCSSTPGAAPVLNLQVFVKWGHNNSVEDATNLDFPTPGIPAYGFLALQFKGDATDSDQNAPAAPWFPATPGALSRVTAIPVTISGQSTPIYPDLYGCVFAELNPGNYTVTVGEPSASPFGTPTFVQNLATDGTGTDPAGGAASLSFAVTITIGQTVTIPALSFDEGTTVGLQYPSSTALEDSVYCPGVGAVACVAAGENGSGAEMEWMSSATGQWSAAPISPANSLTRIESFACADVTTRCVGVGYGPGGSIVSSPTGSFAPTVDALSIAGVTVTQLTQVTCPSLSLCVAIGNGVVSGTARPIALWGTISAGGDTWHAITLPAAPQVTSLSQVVCPSATTCVAIGAAGAAGVELSGPPGGPWVYGTSTDVGGSTAGGATPKDLTLTSLTSVSCASAAACMAIGTGSIGVTSGSTVIAGGPIGPVVLTGSVTGSGSTWSIDLFPATLVSPSGSVSSLSQVLCPSTTQCLISGLGTIGGTAGAFILTGSPTFTPPALPASQNQLLTKDTLPAAGGSPISLVTQLACPTSLVCAAIGSGGSNQAILSGAIGSGPDIWSTAGAPAAVTGLTSIVCPDVTDCLIAGTSTSTSGQPDAVLLSGSPGTSATWTLLTLPSQETGIAYLYGISCTPHTSATCTAVGATAKLAAITSTTTGPGGPWTDHTSDSGLVNAGQSLLTGNVVTGVPIEFATAGNPGIINTASANAGYWNTVAAGGSPNTTTIGPVFPFTSGYTVFAGDCPSEQPISRGTVLASAPPGLTSPTPVTVPLGVLPLKVVGGSFVPSSDTVHLQSTASSPCSTHTYTLQTPGADGLSRSEVPFGSYSLTMTSGSTTTAAVAVIVAPGSVTVGGTTTRLPTTVTVTGP